VRGLNHQKSKENEEEEERSGGGGGSDSQKCFTLANEKKKYLKKINR
jgi:hypothetical protein